MKYNKTRYERKNKVKENSWLHAWQTTAYFQLTLAAKIGFFLVFSLFLLAGSSYWPKSSGTAT